ncbi:hypothetical protein [Streptomyces sp. NPDC047525]|uniref:hypothetical protein n=1 Tax=Streptomyces sp. NPDC047525 TaxID=3155264 RepID=UPI00341140C5
MPTRPTSDNGAKGHSDLSSRAECGELSLPEGDALTAHQVQLSVDGNTQPETASLSLLDATGNPKKQCSLQEPRAIKVDTPQTGNAQSATIQFTNLTVD